MPTPNAPSPREMQQQRYRTARANLGLMLALTVVNIVLLLTGSDSMLLFSATVPYFTSILAYTAVQYGLSANMTLFVICVAVTVMSVLLYALCWALSKKHVGWMIAALVLFSIDTAFMGYLYVAGQDTSGILDAVIHAWVIYYLVLGVISGKALKTMPSELSALFEQYGEPMEDGDEEIPPSEGMYPADNTVKARVLAEADAAGHHIVYRRVKPVNELVIDGYVYATYESRIEYPHTLCANVNGTIIEAGMTPTPHSFITVNGETIVKKFRLV